MISLRQNDHGMFWCHHIDFIIHIRTLIVNGQNHYLRVCATFSMVSYGDFKVLVKFIYILLWIWYKNCSFFSIVYTQILLLRIYLGYCPLWNRIYEYVWCHLCFLSKCLHLRSESNENVCELTWLTLIYHLPRIGNKNRVRIHLSFDCLDARASSAGRQSFYVERK